MRLYIEGKEKKKKEPDERNYCTPRRRRKKEVHIHVSKKEIGVIQRSTNFDRERFLISSGDVDEQPEAEFVP
jgi:hypothetical protein